MGQLALNSFEFTRDAALHSQLLSPPVRVRFIRVFLYTEPLVFKYMAFSYYVPFRTKPTKYLPGIISWNGFLFGMKPFETSRHCMCFVQCFWMKMVFDALPAGNSWPLFKFALAVLTIP